MGDAELEAIRQRRMQEIMAQQGGMPTSSEDNERMEEARKAQDDQRQVMLHSLMSSDARARLARIALVKPDKAKRVEDLILGAAKRGAIAEKISEERLVELLEQIQEKEGASKPKVTIQRRRPVFEDDD